MKMCSQHSRYTTRASGSHFSSYTAGMWTVQVFRIRQPPVRRPRPYLQQTLHPKHKQIRILTQITIQKICKIMQHPDPKRYNKYVKTMLSRNVHDFCKTMHVPVDLLHVPVPALDFTTGQVVFGPCPACSPLAPQKKCSSEI